MLVESLANGVGVGLVFGIANGIFDAYKQEKWFRAIIYSALGVTLMIDPSGGLPSSLSDLTFLITGLPTWAIAEWRTKKAFKRVET